jgi:hypothetical protein
LHECLVKCFSIKHRSTIIFSFEIFGITTKSVTNRLTSFYILIIWWNFAI